MQCGALTKMILHSNAPPLLEASPVPVANITVAATASGGAGVTADTPVAAPARPGSPDPTKQKTYSDADAASWSLDVARCLEYLHAQKPPVVHRGGFAAGLHTATLSTGAWLLQHCLGAQMSGNASAVCSHTTMHAHLRLCGSWGPRCWTWTSSGNNTAQPSRT